MHRAIPFRSLSLLYVPLKYQRRISRQRYKCCRQIAHTSGCCYREWKLTSQWIPKDEIEWELVRTGFTNITTSSVHDGRCCGALDGFFQSTKQPTREEAMGNPKAFFSGHYLSYGLNCQALCDARLQFLYFAVIAPGKVNDAIVIENVLTFVMQSKTFLLDIIWLVMQHMISLISC